MMEKAGLDGLRQNSADYLHLLIEVIKCVFADREYYNGDPDFVDVPLERLHSEANINEWLKQIDPKKAMPDLPVPHGVNEPFRYPATEGLPVRDPDTSYLCAVDKWGNAFSATPSDGMWRSPVVPGLGLIPSPRGTQSRTDPNHPSGVGPGRRPRLTPNPAIARRDDGTVVPFGAPSPQFLRAPTTPAHDHGLACSHVLALHVLHVLPIVLLARQDDLHDGPHPASAAVARQLIRLPHDRLHRLGLVMRW
jgi:gamma-glutamyltranspeptidase/glutathione hydrolase